MDMSVNLCFVIMTFSYDGKLTQVCLFEIISRQALWKGSEKKEGERLFVQFESCLNVFHYLWMIHRCYEAGCEKRLLCYVHRTLSNRSFYRPSLVPFTRILEFKQLHYVYCLSLFIKHISDTTSAPKSVVHNNYDSQTWLKMKLRCWYIIFITLASSILLSAEYDIWGTFIMYCIIIY